MVSDRGQVQRCGEDFEGVKMKRDELKDFFKSWYIGEFDESDSPKLLQEQDDIFGDEAADEEGGEDEAADEEGGDEAGEDEAADEEGGEEAGEEEAEVEEVAIETGDEVRLGKQFDIALDSILADYEMNALKSAQIHTIEREEVVDVAVAATTEWWNRGLDSLLFEQEEEAAAEEEEAQVSENQLDIDLFAQDVARLINNYDVLMDMESIVFNKAKEFLMIKYGDTVAEAFAEILRISHGLDFDSEIEELEDIADAAPLAVGASGGGGGGGAV